MIAPALLVVAASALAAATAMPASAPTEPARMVPQANLSLAQDVVRRLMPPGTYAKLMNGSMTQITDTLTSQIRNVPLSRMMTAMGVPADKAKTFTMDRMMAAMAIVDPHYEERNRLTMQAMIGGITRLMTGFEPQLLEATAQAYAAQFTQAQLADIIRFLDTPSGQAFAARASLIATDPAIRRQTAAIIPALMQAMPDILAQAKKASDALPPPRDAAMLTAAERARLGQLLGIDPKTIEKAKEPAS